MTEPRPLARTASEFEAEFRESRLQTLISVNLKTYWAIAVIVPAFGIWDYYADPVHWRRAVIVRIAGAAIVAATGIYQNLPGKARALPLMAKLRLIVAAMASIVAASLLDRGYGFGVAGLIVIVLTGPYIAIDSRDLLRTNLAALATVAVLMVVLPLDWFDVVGTIVFVVLAVVVSTLLGRVLEASHRRAFTLELEQHHDARTDSLTGLANRRAMQEIGRLEVKRAHRMSTPVSVILADLDHFKSINDKFGHEAGDRTLFEVARILRESLRESDALGRWGGEEFMVILPGTAGPGAAEVAQRICNAVATAEFDGLTDGATISLGVASSELIEDHAMEWDLLIKEADQRLYRAKHEGRNRVVSTSS